MKKFGQTGPGSDAGEGGGGKRKKKGESGDMVSKTRSRTSKPGGGKSMRIDLASERVTCDKGVSFNHEPGANMYF